MRPTELQLELFLEGSEEVSQFFTSRVDDQNVRHKPAWGRFWDTSSKPGF